MIALFLNNTSSNMTLKLSQNLNYLTTIFIYLTKWRKVQGNTRGNTLSRKRKKLNLVKHFYILML